MVIVAPNAATAYTRLEAAGYRRRSALTIAGTSWESPEGVAVDVLEQDDSWEAAIKQASSNRDQQGLPILPLPYLVLLKMDAARIADSGDVTRMLGLASDEALEAVRALIRERLPDQLEDLESMISLGRLEWEQP